MCERWHQEFSWGFWTFAALKMMVILAFFTRTVFLAVVFASPKDNITMCYSKQSLHIRACLSGVREKSLTHSNHWCHWELLTFSLSWVLGTIQQPCGDSQQAPTPLPTQELWQPSAILLEIFTSTPSFSHSAKDTLSTLSRRWLEIIWPYKLPFPPNFLLSTIHRDNALLFLVQSRPFHLHSWPTSHFWHLPLCVITSLMCLSLSLVQLFATPWTIAHQASLFMEFSRQEYRRGLPFFSPVDLPDPGIEPRSPAFTIRASREAPSSPLHITNCSPLYWLSAYNPGVCSKTPLWKETISFDPFHIPVPWLLPRSF